jgi:hypothetical protein
MGRLRSRKSMCRNPLLSKSPRRNSPSAGPQSRSKFARSGPPGKVSSASTCCASLQRWLIPGSCARRSGESPSSATNGKGPPKRPLPSPPPDSAGRSRSPRIDPEPRNRAPRPRPLIHPYRGAIGVQHHGRCPLRAWDRKRTDRCDHQRQKDSGTCSHLEAPFGFRL